MAAESRMLELGTPLPDFSLPDTSGRRRGPAEFADAKGMLVVFMCNHCPFVLHILEGLTQFARDYQTRGLAIVAINANDAESYPDDSPANMAKLAAARQFSFPYLFDATQSTAKAFEAACTPDFFLFDGGRRLVYRGQFDGSRPGGRLPVTGVDLRAAADALFAGRTVDKQVPSLGCSIKWRR
jgi:peroxiredoxin